MTESNKDIDFSSVLEEASKHSVSDRQNTKFKKYMWVTATAATLILAFAGYLIFAFAAKTDFSTDTPLSENISRWTPLSWKTEGIKDGEGVPFTAKNVDWVPSTEGQYFDGTFNDSACNLSMMRIGNGLGSTDEGSTNEYSQEFRTGSGSGEFITENVWLDTVDADAQVEFVKASYVNGEDGHTYSYYRGTPENNSFVMLIVSCDDVEALQELMPDEGGAEVAELAVLEPAFFSPF